MITYNGNSLYPFGFGLYGFEDIQFESSKENIEENFKDAYEDKIKELLLKNGLKYMGMDYYSPNAYNFANDSLDLNIKVVSKEKLTIFIINNRERINKLLKSNKSYDGYISTTPDSISDEDLNSPSIIVLSVMLEAIDFREWDMNEHLVLESE